MTKFKSRFLTSLLLLVIFTMTFSTTAFAGGPDYEEPTEETATEEPAVIEPGEPLSEGSDIVTRDLLYDKATNKQFITITDREGNTFYLVIDYDAPINEDEEQYQTYFLNPVDLSDLEALAEETETEPVVCTCTERCVAGAIDMNCPVCASNMTECAGKEPEPVEPEEPVTAEPVEPETAEGMNPAVLVVVLLLLAGGGAFAYLKLVKNKPKTKGSTDLDDYDYGDAEDEDEDDAPWESEEELSEPIAEEADDAEEEPDEDTDQ